MVVMLIIDIDIDIISFWLLGRRRCHRCLVDRLVFSSGCPELTPCLCLVFLIRCIRLRLERIGAAE